MAQPYNLGLFVNLKVLNVINHMQSPFCQEGNIFTGFGYQNMDIFQNPFFSVAQSLAQSIGSTESICKRDHNKLHIGLRSLLVTMSLSNPLPENIRECGRHIPPPSHISQIGKGKLPTEMAAEDLRIKPTTFLVYGIMLQPAKPFGQG